MWSPMALLIYIPGTEAQGPGHMGPPCGLEPQFLQGDSRACGAGYKQHSAGSGPAASRDRQ